MIEKCRNVCILIDEVIKQLELEKNKNPKWFFCSSCMTFIFQYHWPLTVKVAPMSLFQKWKSQPKTYRCCQWKYTGNTEPKSKSTQNQSFLFIILTNQRTHPPNVLITDRQWLWWTGFPPRGVFSSPDVCCDEQPWGWESCSCWQQPDSV